MRQPPIVPAGIDTSTPSAALLAGRVRRTVIDTPAHTPAPPSMLAAWRRSARSRSWFPGLCLFRGFFMSPANMSTPAATEATKVALKRDFPGWRFLRSDRGRWWALRGPLPMNRINEVDTLVSNTAEGLRVELARTCGGVR